MDFPDDDFDTTPAADDGEPDCPGGCAGRGCPDCGVLDLDEPAQQRALVKQLLGEHHARTVLRSAGTWAEVLTLINTPRLHPQLENVTEPQMKALIGLVQTAQVAFSWPGQDDADAEKPAEDPRIGIARTAFKAMERVADALVFATDPTIAALEGDIHGALVRWREADDPDEPVLPDLTVYRALRGPFDESQPLVLGTYQRVEDAMRHSEDDYRDHHDPRRLDELSWQVLAGYSDRVWLHAGRDGEKPEPTEWHVQAVTVAGAYDPQAEG